MKKLLIRTISGIVYIGLILFCYFAGQTWFAALTICLAGLAYEELATLTTVPVVWRRCLIPLIDLLVLIALILGIANIIPVWAPVLLFIGRFVTQLYRHSEDPGKRLAVSVLSIVYLGIGLGSMLAMATTGKIVLAVLFFIWLNDTGAYCVGSLIGRHKLFQRISPKKTWEGFIGGLTVCVIASVVFCRWLNPWFDFLPQQQYLMWILLAVVTVIFATWGDLVESMIKRSIGVKDSGHLIPGHCGMLDRIDSMLMAMPAVWCLMQIIELINN